jgi:hypothetical protein
MLSVQALATARIRGCRDNRRACGGPDGIDAQEREYLEALQAITLFEVQRGRLTLLSESGRLLFRIAVSDE